MCQFNQPMGMFVTRTRSSFYFLPTFYLVELSKLKGGSITNQVFCSLSFLSSTIIKTEIQPDVIDFVPENETYWQMALALLTYLPKYLLGWIAKVRTIWFSPGTGTTCISTNDSAALQFHRDVIFGRSHNRR